MLNILQNIFLRNFEILKSPNYSIKLMFLPKFPDSTDEHRQSKVEKCKENQAAKNNDTQADLRCQSQD